MKLFTLLLCFNLIGCSSFKKEAMPDLQLSKYENVAWKTINLSNAGQEIGQPDMIKEVDHNDVVWVYVGGTPPSSRLTLLFNKSNGKLDSATWFFRSYDQKSDMKSIAERYHFDLTSPRASKDYFGTKKKFYLNNQKSMEMTVLVKENVVEAISWLNQN